MPEQTEIVDPVDGQGLSDPEVWRELKKGDKKALEILVRRHYEDLSRYAIKFCDNKKLAEDSVQDLFLMLWRNRKDLDDVEAVKTYLWRALRNGIISKLRKVKRRKKILRRENAELQPEVKLNVEELIIEQEIDVQTREELEKALNQLSSRQREALYLKFYDGMNYEEIETIMSVSYQTVRNYIHEALSSLKSTLK
ncbi:sigma-70 family RNA polymerase sigma factor [Aliifodinibius sp. S!AR15-10]|uniref:RNA polymerase sigma factor n=1 Tax=Aliifodinibius sp. S!AR15-10 TaxID=2950437 RepID=UPI00286371CA|nr:sigma-70 family RNA polymerase sigma factor [Aliifodinibius sp. S!AR15-10]MDR8391862.1 sigma-70 family RNA polymerase sigma factor [Aliifodinibius sp. S!AR15-10]